MFKEIMESVIKLENYNQRKNNENKKIKTNDSLSENPCSFEEGKIKNNNGTNSTYQKNLNYSIMVVKMEVVMVNLYHLMLMFQIFQMIIVKM